MLLERFMDGVSTGTAGGDLGGEVVDWEGNRKGVFNAYEGESGGEKACPVYQGSHNGGRPLL